MTDTIIKVDLKKSAYENENIHNRWHPDIPMAAMVKPGDDFKIECVDWTGGQIKNNDDASDVRDVDLSQVHFLSGPVGMELFQVLAPFQVTHPASRVTAARNLPATDMLGPRRQTQFLRRRRRQSHHPVAQPLGVRQLQPARIFRVGRVKPRNRFLKPFRFHAIRLPQIQAR